MYLDVATKAPISGTFLFWYTYHKRDISFILNERWRFQNVFLINGIRFRVQVFYLISLSYLTTAYKYKIHFLVIVIKLISHFLNK